MTDKTCAERIGDQLAGRLADLGRLNSGQPSDPEPSETEDDRQERAYEELAEYPLGVSFQTVVRVDLSTGGPADWLELFYEPDPVVPVLMRVVYHFADWFDHAEVTLERGDFDTVEAAFGHLIEVVGQ